MEDVALVTMFDDTFKGISDISLPNISKYCSLYNIPLYYSSDDLGKLKYNCHRPFSWNKVLYLIDLLPKHKWLVWMDIDAVFINFSIDIRSFINNNFSIIMRYHYKYNHIAAGVFFIKNDDISKEFLLSTYWDVDDRIINDRWWEQLSMIYRLNNKRFKEATCYKDCALFNNMNDNLGEKSLSETFIYHTAEGTVEEKINNIKSALPHVK